jgi:hypothetical protein
MDVLTPQWPAGSRRLARRAAGWILFAGLVCVAAAWPAADQTNQLTESQIKAGFLFNLTKFVEWPDTVFADARDPIVFGILGADPLGNALNRAVSGQAVRGRTISVRRYNFGDDLRRCHVLFVSTSEQARVRQILASLPGASVLTVSDADQFADAGGVIQFVVQENRVRFVVNRDAAAQARLQISAKLLTLARVISRASVPGIP